MRKRWNPTTPSGHTLLVHEGFAIVHGIDLGGGGEGEGDEGDEGDEGEGEGFEDREKKDHGAAK